MGAGGVLNKPGQAIQSGLVTESIRHHWNAGLLTLDSQEMLRLGRWADSHFFVAGLNRRGGFLNFPGLSRASLEDSQLAILRCRLAISGEQTHFTSQTGTGRGLVSRSTFVASCSLQFADPGVVACWSDPLTGLFISWKELQTPPRCILAVYGHRSFAFDLRVSWPLLAYAPSMCALPLNVRGIHQEHLRPITRSLVQDQTVLGRQSGVLRKSGARRSQHQGSGDQESCKGTDPGQNAGSSGTTPRGRAQRSTLQHHYMAGFFPVERSLMVPRPHCM